MSANSSLLRTSVVPFIRVGDGEYQSKAYWGVGKLKHRYRISRKKYGWTLQIDDDEATQHFFTKRDAVGEATRHARRDA
jgi:hypothetical protein